MKTLSKKDKDKLVELCQKYARDHHITCSECVHQQDDVILDAYDFLANIFDIVGYEEIKYEP